MKISLPLSSFLNGAVQCAKDLSSRLSRITLQPPWVVVSKSPLVLCNIRVEFGSAAVVTITVNIDDGCQWSVNILDKCFQPGKGPLVNLPLTLKSVSEVYSVVEFFSSTKFCIGNPDIDFVENWQKQQLSLYGSSGLCNHSNLDVHNCHHLLGIPIISSTERILIMLIFFGLYFYRKLGWLFR